MKPSRIPLVTTGIVLAFFYLPIAALVAKSFNSSRFSPEWKGFTLKWYERLFERDDIFAALVNSLKVAVIAASASMLLGTCAAFALHRYKQHAMARVLVRRQAAQPRRVGDPAQQKP